MAFPIRVVRLFRALGPWRLSLMITTCVTTACAPALRSDRELVGLVARELDDLHAAASRGDEERYFRHFAPDGVFLGTDQTERWDVPSFRAYAHARFTQGRTWTYHVLRRAVSFSADGRVAWFDEDLMGEKAGPCRGSGVLVLVDGHYRIVQYNLAVTIPNERFAEVRALLAQ